jgi:hypothetical protein
MLPLKKPIPVSTASPEKLMQRAAWLSALRSRISIMSTQPVANIRIRSTHRRIAAGLSALLGLGLLAFGAVARADGEGDVNVGGEHVLTVRFPANGMSIKDRADAITDRLTRILSDPNLKPSDITVQPSGKDAVIMVKDRLLVTVDAQTAHFNQTKPLALAQFWAAHLRVVLPKVNFRPNKNGE